MNLLPLLEAKRDGIALRPDQIASIIRHAVAGDVPDYQLAALLMAVFFRGLNAEELRAWTLSMRDSGDTLNFPVDPRPLVDKHSTGGIGDKVSLPLAPLLACLGFRVPMIAGRGLGITGGTLDKLEAIPGFRIRLERDEIVDIVQRVGCCICGQTARMAPADRILYALRDATGTVPSIPLITASILSKKLAESIGALVLDVKCGRAAFMTERDSARRLARTLTELANDCGVHTRALITAMDAPLGRTAGNWLEVQESEACLAGQGAADLEELVVECASELLLETAQESDLRAARLRSRAELASGRPLRKWRDLLASQGGRLDEYEAWLAQDSLAAHVAELRAERSGFVTRCDARRIGEVIRDLGAGRLRKEDTIRPEVGIDQLAKPGQEVRAGHLLLRVHAASRAAAEDARQRLGDAFSIDDAPWIARPLILERL